MDTPYVRNDSAQINPLTRRQALTAATAAAVIPATTIADPHHAWLEEWRVLSERYNSGSTSSDRRTIAPEMNRLGDLIADTPALTTNGMVAKVQFLREDSEDYAREMLDSNVISTVLSQLETFLERLS
jgi:hypothetical protein